MRKNTIIGLLLLVAFALSFVGGLCNGTFSSLGDKNIGYYIGLFGAMGTLLVLGIYFLTKKNK